jgi:hypothetical protein
MNRSPTVDLFVEDRAHEEFLKALLTRIAREVGREIRIVVRSARGGHPRVLSELAAYQKSVTRAVPDLTIPDLLIVAIDANCQRWNQAQAQIEKQMESTFREKTVIACPDPHIERWYLADPSSFGGVVGRMPVLGKKKCARDHYKGLLAKSIADAGHPPTLGGIEFAQELVDAMDLYRAGKKERSLKHFVEAALDRIRSL